MLFEGGRGEKVSYVVLAAAVCTAGDWYERRHAHVVRDSVLPPVGVPQTGESVENWRCVCTS